MFNWLRSLGRGNSRAIRINAGRLDAHFSVLQDLDRRLKVFEAHLRVTPTGTRIAVERVRLHTRDGHTVEGHESCQGEVGDSGASEGVSDD